MIDIENLREYYKQSKVFMSGHASNRCMQREITQKDIKNCVMTGEIIEQYPDDFPWSSCLIPASNEPSAVLARAFGECREGHIPRCSAALQA